MIHPSTRARFGKIVPALLEWHRANRRSFIWRDLKRSPYVVMVSEFMLQQTGAKQVEKKLPEFLRAFPSMQKLARASRSEIVRAWQGLGYNRRAINLHRAAMEIATLRQFPKKQEELQALPGIGRYTASAIRCFAFNEDVPVVDVNIERVLSRLWKRMPDANATFPIRDVYLLDEAILPMGESSNWHESLMDLGSTICTKKPPKCAECPVNRFCPNAGRLKAVAPKSKSTEKLYFGQPRRIWRGRILQAIASGESLTPNMLLALLKNKFEINDSSFVHFVRSVLGTLKEEGFLKSSKGVLALAGHD